MASLDGRLNWIVEDVNNCQCATKKSIKIENFMLYLGEVFKG